MDKKELFVFTLVLLVTMVMVAVVHALEYTDTGASSLVIDQDMIYEEVDINLLKDIDSEVLHLMDSNRDGNVSLAEFTQTGASDILFQIADANKDHFLTSEDLNAFTAAVESDGQGKQLMAPCCWVKIAGCWYVVCWSNTDGSYEPIKDMS